MKEQTQPNVIKISKSNNWIKILLVSVLEILIVAGAVFAGTQIKNWQTTTPPQKIIPTTNLTPTESITPTTPSKITPTIYTSSGWKTAKIGGAFSYEYPEGWNVAELWQENYAENGIIIAIDPNPINTSPRGGPLATFEITVLSGNKNPDEILAKRMGDFNETNYYDITKETISADIGKIYHYKGKISGEMLKGSPIESYFFTFKINENDSYNQQVVIGTLALKEDPALSAMLRHIVLSIKKITP